MMEALSLREGELLPEKSELYLMRVTPWLSREYLGMVAPLWG